MDEGDKGPLGQGESETDPSGGRSAESSLVDELRSLGLNLAATLRAAGRTDEAEALKSDLREGMRTMRGEIDTALSGSSVEALRHKAQSTKSGQVRIEVAGAVRGLNRALERLAASLEPSAPASGAPESEVPNDPQVEWKPQGGEREEL